MLHKHICLLFFIFFKFCELLYICNALMTLKPTTLTWVTGLPDRTWLRWSWWWWPWYRLLANSAGWTSWWWWRNGSCGHNQYHCLPIWSAIYHPVKVRVINIKTSFNSNLFFAAVRYVTIWVQHHYCKSRRHSPETHFKIPKQGWKMRHFLKSN